jgi:hypothetical protein
VHATFNEIVMRIIYSLCVIIILIITSLQAEVLPYISPGFTLSINFSGHVIFSPKVSIGLAENGRFYNITFGKSFSSDTNVYPNHFIELQYGALSEHFEYRKQSLFVGGGIGFTFPSSKIEHAPSLRVSMFIGFLCFINATLLFKDNVEVDIGPQFVLPLPLKKIEVGSLGG